MGLAARSLTSQVSLRSEAGRRQLTKMVMRLFDQWQLSNEEQLVLLGLQSGSRKMLPLYRKLEKIMPYERDKIDRIGLLLSIYKNLAALFPGNKKLRLEWVKRKNTVFDNQRPLDIMLDQGIFGLAKIMRYLDLQLVH